MDMKMSSTFYLQPNNSWTHTLSLSKLMSRDFLCSSLRKQDYKKWTFGWKFSSLSFWRKKSINELCCLVVLLYTTHTHIYLQNIMLLTRSVCRNFIDSSFYSSLINAPWPWSASLSHLFIKFIKISTALMLAGLH